MPGSPVYLDECVPHMLAEALHERGFFVASAAEVGNAGLNDSQQLSYAADRGWVLVTHNRNDFQRLNIAFRRDGIPHSGIIVLPDSPPFERLVIRAAMMLSWIQTLPSPDSQLFKWGHLQERLVQGYRLPGYSESDVRNVLGR